MKLKTSMLRSSLCNYSDAYIIASATVTVRNTAVAGVVASNRKNKIIKNYASFTNWRSELNNTQIDNAEHIDIDLINYSDF